MFSELAFKYGWMDRIEEIDNLGNLFYHPVRPVETSGVIIFLAGYSRVDSGTHWDHIPILKIGAAPSHH